MGAIKILSVGKIKTKHWQGAAAFYTGRINHFCKLQAHAVRDAESSLPLAKRLDLEAERLRKHIQAGDVLICLDEKGKGMTSREFAALLQHIWDNGGAPAFVLGGAYGIQGTLKKEARHLLCLGPMTMTHELAQVVLLEQVYRACNIIAGTGYHHD